MFDAFNESKWSSLYAYLVIDIIPDTHRLWKVGYHDKSSRMPKWSDFYWLILSFDLTTFFLVHEHNKRIYIYIYFRSVWFWASFVWLLLEAKSFVELNASTSNINFWGPTTCLVSCFRSDVCDTRKYSNAVQCRKWYDMVVFDLQFMVVNLHEIFGSWGNGMMRYMARESMTSKIEEMIWK